MRNLGEFEPLSKAAPPREAQPWSLVKSSVKTTRLPELGAVSSGEECWLLGEFNALKLFIFEAFGGERDSRSGNGARHVQGFDSFGASGRVGWNGNGVRQRMKERFIERSL